MRKTTPTWFILLALTLLAFLLGYLEIINNFFVFLLLVTTFIKGQLIVDYFMKLSEVQLRYRILPTIWMTIVLGLIGVAYYTPIL
jgi:cytochrome c oxidase subunit 4